MPSTYNGADNYTASLTIPSDGDPANVASINPALEALQDDAVACHGRLGNFRLITLLSSGVNEASNSETMNLTSGSTIASTTSNTLMLGLGSFALATNGDIVELVVSGTLELTGSGGPPNKGWARVFLSQNGGAYAAVANAVTSLENTVNAQPTFSPFSIACYAPISVTGAAAFALYGHTDVAVNNLLSLIGSLSCVGRLWRPN